jgi:hypothetical protein
MTAIPNKELYVVEIESKRLIHECYFMNAKEENNWRHQYSLNMLNEKNESKVRLCLKGNLEIIKKKKYDPGIYDYGSLGIHESPYYALTFDSICNSRECYSISDPWTYTCPNL